MRPRLIPTYGIGWIYIMMTPSDYNRVKIGITKNNPLLRLRDLKTGDPYLAIEAAYLIQNDTNFTTKVIESFIHSYFADVRIHFLDDEDRINVPSEWFTMDPQQSSYLVEEALKKMGFTITSSRYYKDDLTDVASKHHVSDLVDEVSNFNLGY